MSQLQMEIISNTWTELRQKLCKKLKLGKQNWKSLKDLSHA